MQFDPAWFLLGLGKVYLLALGVLAAGGAVVASLGDTVVLVNATAASATA